MVINCDGQAAWGVDPRVGSQRPGGCQSSSSQTRPRHNQLLALDKERPLPLSLQRHLAHHHREPPRDKGHQEERVLDAEQLAGGVGDVPAQVVDVLDTVWRWHLQGKGGESEKAAQRVQVRHFIFTRLKRVHVRVDRIDIYWMEKYTQWG